jgi:hypothetical protein
MVDFYSSLRRCHSDHFIDSQLPDNQNGDSQSGKKFENGVKKMYQCANVRMCELSSKAKIKNEELE